MTGYIAASLFHTNFLRNCRHSTTVDYIVVLLLQYASISIHLVFCWAIATLFYSVCLPLKLFVFKLSSSLLLVLSPKLLNFITILLF